MPDSLLIGKSWTRDLYRGLADRGLLRRVLDIGTGCGTYSTLLRGIASEDHWTGVEAWRPYLAEYELADKYDTLLVEDARTIDWSGQGPFDIAFMGDVLEHMTKVEAMALAAALAGRCRFLLLSIPIVKLPQDAVGGNPYERHVKDDWSHEEVLASFPGIAAHYGKRLIGVYVAAADEADRAIATEVAAGLPDDYEDDVPIEADIDATYAKAIEFSQKRNWQMAETACQIILAQGFHAEASLLLALALIFQNRAANAEAVIRDGLARNAADGRLYRNLAVALNMQGRSADAVAVLDQGLAALPGDPDLARQRESFG